MNVIIKIRPKNAYIDSEALMVLKRGEDNGNDNVLDRAILMALEAGCYDFQLPNGQVISSKLAFKLRQQGFSLRF